MSWGIVKVVRLVGQKAERKVDSMVVQKVDSKVARWVVLLVAWLVA